MDTKLVITLPIKSSKSRVTKRYVYVKHVENAQAEVKDPECPAEFWLTTKYHFAIELKPPWEETDSRHDPENLPVSFRATVVVGSLTLRRLFPHFQLMTLTPAAFEGLITGLQSVQLKGFLTSAVTGKSNSNVFVRNLDNTECLNESQTIP